MSLFCKTSGNLILVGDILRSISVLEYKQTTSASGVVITTLEEVSRDFNSNYMRAVEILSDQYFLGAEDNGNIFILKRPSSSSAFSNTHVNLTEEEKSRLEMQSAFHVGDFINVFRHGMMGASSTVGNADSLTEKSSTEMEIESSDSLCTNVSPVLLFGTVAGCLGAVFILSADMFHFLNVLEKSINLVIRSMGGLSHEDYRQFAHERRQGHSRKTIDGDLIEMFLDLTESQMSQVTKNLNDELSHLAHLNSQESARAQKKSNVEINNNKNVPLPSFTVDEVIQRIEELQRLH
jgi:DNA damage-binding protein 1